MSSLCQLYTISSYLLATSISNCTFPFEHIPSSHSHLYSILLTLLCILPLSTQLSCVCLPRFWLFCLFVYLWFGFLVVCLCIFCDLVFSLLLVFFCFAGTALSQYSHISLLGNNEIRKQHLYRLNPNQPSSKCKKHCKQYVELARCERVMTTRAEFHFSWVYTFSVTCGSEQPIHRERPVATQHPPAQLCLSSSSSFPHICTTTSWNWTVTKLI